MTVDDYDAEQWSEGDDCQPIGRTFSGWSLVDWDYSFWANAQLSRRGFVIEVSEGIKDWSSTLLTGFIDWQSYLGKGSIACARHDTSHTVSHRLM